MRADVVLADEGIESRLGEHGQYLGVDAREHDVYALLHALLAEVSKVVYTGRVDEGHLTHAYDAHRGDGAHVVHHLFEAVGDAEEVGAIDLVHLHAVGDGEVLGIVGQVGVGAEVNLASLDRYVGHLCHAAHEEQTGDEDAHLDGHGEVKDDGEEEGREQHDDVALGVLEDGLEAAPLAHIVGHHYEDTCQACHGDILGQGHEEEIDEQQHEGVDDTCDTSATAVIDIGHRTRNSSCCGDTAEEGRNDVGNTLTNEFLV